MAATDGVNYPNIYGWMGFAGAIYRAGWLDATATIRRK
jgi:hypothetical protein